MKTEKTTYLSLGSNLGDKLQNLQTAVDLISDQIGAIKKIASIYKTASWGYKGEDFYNTCIQVSTYLTADKLMVKLLSIEEEMIYPFLLQ